MSLKILVIGFGSIAKRHIKNIRLIDPQIEIAVWRQQSRSNDLGELSPFVKEVFFSEKDALSWKPNVALITNPASQHLSTAIPLVTSGIHLFIEKPVSHSSEGVDQMIRLAQRNKVIVTVGYNFRFYEPFCLLKKLISENAIGRILSIRAEVGAYLPDWRPTQDYRTCTSAKKALGGGVLLELSHEIDYIRWLMGEVKSVSAKAGKASDLEIDVEDNADILLNFESGITGNLHLDMIDRARTRTCRIIGADGTLTWDGSTHEVKIYSANTKNWSTLLETGQVDLNNMYVEELKHFFKTLTGEASPIVECSEAQKVLKIVLAAKLSSEQGKTITL